MIEVEQKYRIHDQEQLIKRLTSLQARCGESQRHEDTYYRHPCRDFVETGEAFRVRKVDSIASVTYKGPKLAVGDGMLKARREIEWCLAPADEQGSQMTELLEALGFTAVTTVCKRRTSYQWEESNQSLAAFTLTIDDVDSVGLFAEIELLVSDQDDAAVEQAGKQIAELAHSIGLDEKVGESYLELLLSQE